MPEQVSVFPELDEISLGMREYLHSRLKVLQDGVSEYTFANLYLFRNVHRYRVAQLQGGRLLVTGRDDEQPFFMLPLGIPERGVLDSLFEKFGSLKAVPESHARDLEDLGYPVIEDRDNFDYLYDREKLSDLRGRDMHKKKNLVNKFTRTYHYEALPLTEERVPDALQVLDQWREERGEADYEPAREALELGEQLVLCGGVYYVEGVPAGYCLGEEIAGNVFLIHFEKALGGYKGLYQFINMSFASILPEKYEHINREQDLGNQGLRQAKMSYRPAGFVRKFRAWPAGSEPSGSEKASPASAGSEKADPESVGPEPEGPPPNESSQNEDSDG